MRLYDEVGTEERITLPYRYTPRHYQIPVWHRMFPSMFGLDTPAARRLILAWHRRAGKDKTIINLITTAAHMRVGNYAYFLPKQTQARKAIWNGIGSDGMRFIDHFPPQLIENIDNGEMFVRFKNGSTIQLIGSDNYDNVVGTNYLGMVFSEFALANPNAWDFFRPILAENGGWAVFISTVRGRNHFHALSMHAEKEMNAGNPDWFYQHLTIEQTQREDGTPVVSYQAYLDEIAAGMDENTARQEFYGDWDAATPGAIYADLLRDERMFGDYPHDPRYPVHTAWDLGLNDTTAVIYFQYINGLHYIIDFDEASNTPLERWVQIVNRKNYVYGVHLGPHDLEQREYTTGKTRREAAAELGLYFDVVPKGLIADGITITRQMLPKMRFNKHKCGHLVHALQSYHREWDETRMVFKDKPEHDWASHPADAMRTLTMGWDYTMENLPSEGGGKPKVLTSF